MKTVQIRDGFTLAEVLITLGIIGVVAAMTMPTLINQTNGAQYKAAYKKALSAISQAVTLNVALDDIGFAEAKAGDKDVKNSVANILGNRMNIVSYADSTTNGYKNFPGTVKTTVCMSGSGDNATETTCTGESTDIKKDKEVTPDTFLFFNDSSMFAFNKTDAVACSLDENVSGAKTCFGVIDVNGIKGPNKVVSCDDDTAATCTVTSPTDIYPVKFYDQTILPASPAAEAVLYGK